jgi:hypothetical protein
MALPPVPADLASRIIGDVGSRIRSNLDDLRPGLADGLRASDHWHSSMEAERLARLAVEPRWSTLRSSCELALTEVHEWYLLAAAGVREAEDDLGHRGAESWIAGAVLHRLAENLAWQVLGDCGLLFELDDGDAGEDEGEEVVETRSPHST